MIASSHRAGAVRFARNRPVGSPARLPPRDVRVRVDDVKVTDSWYSERLEQPIGLARWGHFGTPVLVFPTAGRALGEGGGDRRLHACGALLEEGRDKLSPGGNLAGQAGEAEAGAPE